MPWMRWPPAGPGQVWLHPPPAWPCDLGPVTLGEHLPSLSPASPLGLGPGVPSGPPSKVRALEGAPGPQVGWGTDTHGGGGAASVEGDAVPGGYEDPGGREAWELREVAPDVARGSAQRGRVGGLPVVHVPCPPIVHVRPEGRHHAAVPGDGKGRGSELRDLLQEGDDPVVVHLSGGRAGEGRWGPAQPRRQRLPGPGHASPPSWGGCGSGHSSGTWCPAGAASVGRGSPGGALALGRWGAQTCPGAPAPQSPSRQGPGEVGGGASASEPGEG